MKNFEKNVVICLLLGLIFYVLSMNFVFTLTAICLAEFLAICLVMLVLLKERMIRAFWLFLAGAFATLIVCFGIGWFIGLGNIYAFAWDYKVFVEMFGGLAIVLTAAAIGVYVYELFSIGSKSGWKSPFVKKSLLWFLRLGFSALICWAFWALKAIV